MKKIIKSKQLGSTLFTIALFALVIAFIGCTSKTDTLSQSDKSAAPDATAAQTTSVVYMTTDITPESLIKMYEALGRELPGKVAVKVHTGEPGGHHFLKPELIKDLVQKVDGTIVECNTAYPGKRFQTLMHKQAAKDHGFYEIAEVDIMDEKGEVSLPFPAGKNIQEDFVGANYKKYDSFLILSHFKGHAMGGFGGALKNMSIGIASGAGKMWIHTAGKTKSLNDFGLAFETEQNSFLESMAEASGAVMNDLGDKVVYINVMNHLSIDCDCNGNPAPPELDDIGILASLDPVALDKACVDQVYASDTKRSASLRERIESRNGTHILDHAQFLGLGTKNYKLVLL